MAFCNNCGTQVQDGVQFCPSCGQAMNAAPAQQDAQPTPPQAQYAPPPPPPPVQQAAPPQQQYPPQQPPYPQQPAQPPIPPQYPQQQYPPQQPQYPPPQQYQQGYAPPQYGVNTAQNDKTMSILSYISILVLIPFLTGAHKTSPTVKFHTNQGLILCIAGVAWSIISSILRAVIRVPYTYTVFGIPGAYGYHTPGWLTVILWLISIPVFVLSIMGIINAVNGQAKKLPVVGNYTILK